MAQVIKVNLQTQLKVTDPIPLNATDGVVGTVFDDPNIILIEDNFDYAFYDSRSAFLMKPTLGKGTLDQKLEITGGYQMTVTLIEGGIVGSEEVLYNPATNKMTIQIANGASTVEQIAAALMGVPNVAAAVIAVGTDIWTLGVGEDEVILNEPENNVKVFEPSFDKAKMLMVEVGANKKVDLIIEDTIGEKTLVGIERLLTLFGTFYSVKLVAQEDNTYIKILMIGTNNP